MSKFINFYKTANGELIIPNKTLLRNSDINIMSNAKFKNAKDLNIINYMQWGKDFAMSYAPTGIPEATWAGLGGWIASDPREQIKDTFYLFKDFAKDNINIIDNKTNNK